MDNEESLLYMLGTCTSLDSAIEQETSNKNYVDQKAIFVKGLSYGTTFGAIFETKYRKQKASWLPTNKQEQPSTTFIHLTKSQASDALNAPSVFVDLASIAPTIDCDENSESPYCEAESYANLGFIPLLRKLNFGNFSQEELTARSFLGTSAQYVVEALVAEELSLSGHSSSDLDAKVALGMAQQLRGVTQIRWFGQNLYAALHYSLDQAGFQNQPLQTYEEVTSNRLKKQNVYVLPWFAFYKTNDDDDQDKGPYLTAIRPDLILGCGNAVHVIELKTHTQFEQQQDAEDLPINQRNKSSHYTNERETSKNWKQAMVQALSVWARVKLLPYDQQPDVYCHLIDCTVNMDPSQKSAHTDVAFVKITDSVARQNLHYIQKDFTLGKFGSKNQFEFRLHDDDGDQVPLAYMNDAYQAYLVPAVTNRPNIKLLELANAIDDM